MRLQARRPGAPLLAALLAALVASCAGDGGPAPGPVTPGDLETLVVADPASGPGRAWDGVVEAVNQATLTAQTGGRVVEVAHDVGDRVAAGAVLVRLDAVEQQSAVDAALAGLRASEAAAREAEAEHARHLELARGRYVSQAQLERAQAARDAAVAARNAARAALARARQGAGYTVVRAPYEGIVARRQVEPGEAVAPGQPLATLFSPDALRIEVALPQAVAEAVREHPRASVQLSDGRTLAADEVVVFPAAEAATLTVRVRIGLPALAPAPAPGTLAKVRFPAAAGAAHPRIPATALVRRGEVVAAYVLGDGGLSLRQLRLGEAASGEVEVIAGLRAGETIAADPVAARQTLVAARGGR